MIRRWLSATLLALAVLSLAPSRADAGFGIGASIGTGFYKPDGDMQRVPTNIELLPTYKFAIVNFDLGIRFNFEEPRDNVQFRPGVRVSLPVLPIYGRLAIPLGTGGDNYGFLFGVGWSMGIGPLSIFAEADVNMNKSLGFSTVPVEFRVGASFGF